MNINEETAIKIMGWEKRAFNEWVNIDGDNEKWFTTLWVPSNCPDVTAEELWDRDIVVYEVSPHKHMSPYCVWRPDQDRSQSRLVVEKAVEILSRYTDNTYDILGDCMDQFTEHDSSWGWIFATPEQECRAALMAVEEAQK